MDQSELVATGKQSALPAPRLCAAVQGVEFWISLSARKQIRCVITESALQAHFDALPSDPDSWIEAFMTHRPRIEAQALAASGRREDVHIVIVTDSNGQLKASVGRCST